MITTPEHDKRIAKITLASVYPYYIKKVERKGRTVDELNEVIQWLTGFEQSEINQCIAGRQNNV